jgi:hypothetical protein
MVRLTLSVPDTALDSFVAALEPTPAQMRARLQELTDGALPSAHAQRPEPRPRLPRLRHGPAPAVAYLLPGLPPEGSGGSHSLVQEARGLRALGAGARVCVPAEALASAARLYGNDDELFVPYLSSPGAPAVEAGATRDGVLAAIGHVDVVIATEYPSVDLLTSLASERPDLLCAYYVQDYEPLFAAPDTARADRALLSYRALPELLLFAKTHWLCNLLDAAHGVSAAKVAPSLDRELFHAGARAQHAGVLRVAAMIRPRTPRRRPTATLAALAAIARELGEGVRISTFGCDEQAFAGLSDTAEKAEPADTAEKAEPAEAVDHAEAADPAGHAEAIDPTVPGLTHLGLLTRMQVAALMRRCDLFIDASAYQAFGRTGLEAMACGAVPLLPALGGVHEYARDGENAVILQEGSPDEIVAEVLALAGDGARLRALRDAGVRAAQDFSIERAARSQFELFAAAIADRAQRSADVLARQPPQPPRSPRSTERIP